MRPTADRIEAWERLGEILDPAIFEDICTEISLEEAADVAADLIAGKVRGRVIVDIQK